MKRTTNWIFDNDYFGLFIDFAPQMVDINKTPYYFVCHDVCFYYFRIYNPNKDKVQFKQFINAKMRRR